MSEFYKLEEKQEAPPWWDKMEFCHIRPEDEMIAYCGYQLSGQIACSDYEGEAICPDCGLPTCPRCAQLESLACALGQ